MPKHSFAINWLHLVWSTKDRFSYFQNSETATSCSEIIKTICAEEELNLKEIFVNSDHVHLLIKLPVDKTVKDTLKTLKGLSSYKINQGDIFTSKFYWARGYAALSVSYQDVENVSGYIRNQKQHHKHKSFSEEWLEYEKIFSLE